MYKRLATSEARMSQNGNSKNLDAKRDLKKITVNSVPIVWNEENRGFSFFGHDSIIFWKNPSLISILNPLREEVGETLYALLIAHEAAKGTYEDYHAIVNSLGSDFESGFLKWGKAVSGAGWGCFDIVSLDWENKKALVALLDPWEIKVFQAKKDEDNVPFLAGKVSGIFSHAFETNCRARVVDIRKDESGRIQALLQVAEEKESLEEALHRVQQEKQATERARLKAANNAYRRTQQRIMDILDTVGEFVWESNDHLVLSYLTSKASSILESNMETLLGTCWYDLIIPDDHLSFRAAMRELDKDDVSYITTEARVRTERDGLRWIRFNIKKIFFSGDQFGYLGSGLDITKEKEMQRELDVQRERSFYTSKMATLGEMAGGIAHEINTPLGTIQLRLSLMQDAIDQDATDLTALKEGLTTIDRTVQRISKVIKGLRAFSRNADDDPFFKANISTIIDDTLALCGERFKKNKVDLRTQIPPDVLVECRPSQISQVVLNILNNAFDAVVELEASWVELKMEALADHIEITITDSGPGIPEDLIPKIMQPFFTTKEVGKGTGLGLSISQGIINQHNGRLWIDKSHKHSRFVIELPYKQPDDN